MDKVFYNKSSADSLGWEPDWFEQFARGKKRMD